MLGRSSGMLRRSVYRFHSNHLSKDNDSIREMRVCLSLKGKLDTELLDHKFDTK